MDSKTLSLHLLAQLASAHAAGVRLGLDELVVSLGVRRADVRTALGRLHVEGLVDVTRMRLSLAGFAVGRALDVATLPALRRAGARTVAA